MGMNLNSYSTQRMAAERFRDFERAADRSHLARDTGAGHASLLARLRHRMPFTPPRERRAIRPARAES